MNPPTLIERFAHVYRAQGMRGVFLAIFRRIKSPHARTFVLAREFVAGASGFEIGGPSRIFDRGGLLPLYSIVGRLDNCNFAAATLWERDASAGETFRFSSAKAPGRQWVAEATNLGAIADASYDFVLSSHALEHTANPLKALSEWRRILKAGGALILIVPHKDGTFDHRRPVTTLDHLQEDYRENRGEGDLTHLAEVLALHDESRDPSIHTLSLTERMQRNLEFRSMHHHVFDTKLAMDMVELAEFDVHEVEPLLPDHIILIAQKGMSGARPPVDNFRSPFPSDALRRRGGVAGKRANL